MRFKKDDKCFLTAKVRKHLSLPNVEYLVKDVLTDIDYPYVIKSSSGEFGEDWVQFFNDNELLKEQETNG